MENFDYSGLLPSLFGFRRWEHAARSEPDRRRVLRIVSDSNPYQRVGRLSHYDPGSR
jgi:hypothetical protein